MDLKIEVTDENGDLLRTIAIYKDGGDHDGCDTLEKIIRAEFGDGAEETIEVY